LRCQREINPFNTHAFVKINKGSKPKAVNLGTLQPWAKQYEKFLETRMAGASSCKQRQIDPAES
jgi:hypothetical protein